MSRRIRSRLFQMQMARARLGIRCHAMRFAPVFSLLAAIYLTLGFDRATAAQLTWAPRNNGRQPPAGGNWDTASGNTVWYNGSGDVAWTQTSTTAGLNGAI